MKGNLSGLLQQAQKMQQEMQDQMERTQQELANLEITGQAGGGMVEVVMNGQHAVRKVRIDSSLSEDLEMLEDLIAAAVNDAVNKVSATNQEKMAAVTSGMSLPPGMKLPF